MLRVVRIVRKHLHRNSVVFRRNITTVPPITPATIIPPIKKSNEIKLVNTQLILPAINKTINSNKGFVEYIFTKPDWKNKLKSSFGKFTSYLTSQQNPYGHGLIRYCNEDIDVIMNISGRGDKLVNFFKPHDYFFVKPTTKNSGNPQGGVFTRSFITIRINNIDVSTINGLHQYYTMLSRMNETGLAKFTILSHIFINPFKNFFMLAHRGNCAYWTSKGLMYSGFMKHSSNWPLLIFFKLLAKNIYNGNVSNVEIISYRSLNYANELKGALMYPFYWIKNTYKKIWNLENFATIIVKPYPIDVEENTFGFEIIQNEKAKQFWLKRGNELLKVKTIAKDL